MNIGLVVNASGKVCLVYDEVFVQGAPLYVDYHYDVRKLEIFFDSEETYLVDWTVTDEMHDFLVKINKILLIRMENRKPVESYETSIIFTEYKLSCFSNGQDSHINTGLVVNDRGKVCLVYDKVFVQGMPLYVDYHYDVRKLEIFFYSGETYLVDWTVTDEMHDFLVKINKILLIRMENCKPVEGYETSIIFTEYKPLCFSNGQVCSIFLNQTNQAVIILPYSMMAFQPDCVEFNGRTGNFSLINGTNKLENIVTLPEEYSSLQFSLLLSDMIKINWRSPNDDRQKNEITEYFVPLTVTFAVDETIGGVYSEQAQTLIADYLTKFKKYNEEILGICPEDVEDSVRGKWNISFDLIKDKSPAVAYLLTVCAFLASEDISLDLISKGITNRSETEETISIDNISLEAAKQSLSHYSLIILDEDKDTISIHNIVQMIARNSLTPEEKISWFNAIVSTINMLLPTDYRSQENRDQIARLLPHATNLIALSENYNLKSNGIILLIETIANYFFLINDYKESIKYYKKLRKSLVNIYDKVGKADCNFQLGRAYYLLSNTKKSLEYFEKALALSLESGDKKVESDVYNGLGKVNRIQGDFNKAVEYQEKALKISLEFGDKRGESNCYLDLGLACYMQDDYNKSLEYFEKALALSLEAGDKKVESEVYNGLGKVNKMQGDFNKAIEYQEKALKISLEFGDKWGESNCYLDLGWVCYMQGDYNKSIEYQEMALKISMVIGKKLGEANSNHAISEVFYMLSDNNKAISHGNKALEIFTEIGNKRGESNCCLTLGKAYYMLGEYDKSITYLKRTLKISVESGYKWGESNSCHELGKAYYMLEDFDRAIAYQEKALKIFAEEDNKWGESNSCYELGKAFCLQGDYKKAVEYLENAVKISVEMDYKRCESNSYHELGKAYYLYGDYNKSIEYQEKALKIFFEISSIAGESYCYFELGKVYHRLDDTAKAIEYQEKALEIYVKNNYKLGEVLCYDELGGIYKTLGASDKVIEYQKKAQKVRIENNLFLY